MKGRRSGPLPAVSVVAHVAPVLSKSLIMGGEVLRPHPLGRRNPHQAVSSCRRFSPMQSV